MEGNVSRDMKEGGHRVCVRSLLEACGFVREDVERPLIGIANSFTDAIAGHAHLNQLTEAVAAGIYAAGGTPIKFGTIGIGDCLVNNEQRWRYSLPSRDLICDSIESVAIGHGLDGIVLVAGCDKTVPGMMMAAARVNIPAIIVCSGAMLPGKHKGQKIDVVTGGTVISAPCSATSPRKRSTNMKRICAPPAAPAPVCSPRTPWPVCPRYSALASPATAQFPPCTLSAHILRVTPVCR